MHTVAVLALHGAVLFDLATPVEVFGRARLPDGRSPYQVVTVAPDPEIQSGSFILRAGAGLSALESAETIVVAGVSDWSAPIAETTLAALRKASTRGVRIASICVGAFVLAQAGLLDGHRVTTHWAAAQELARTYTKVDVDPSVLYIDGGTVLTSAGAAAGLDLCLYLVRRDHGSAVAAEVARQCVMPLERAGGQAQFITREPPAPDGSSLTALLEWLETNSHLEDLDLNRIAAQARLSTRTLSRHFVQQTGTTPLAWLNRVRIRRAQQLLETTDLPVEQIATEVGYSSVTAFRERFRGLVEVSPKEYRRTFHRAPAAAAVGGSISGSSSFRAESSGRR